MSIFSNRLTALRENKGWSKTHVAHLVGVSSMQTYANWEYGRTEPDFDVVKKLAKLFDVSTDYLLGNDTKPTTNKSEHVDLEKDPVVLSYGGKPISKGEMKIIKEILARFKNEKDNSKK